MRYRLKGNALKRKVFAPRRFSHTLQNMNAKTTLPRVVCLILLISAVSANDLLRRNYAGLKGRSKSTSHKMGLQMRRSLQRVGGRLRAVLANGQGDDTAQMKEIADTASAIHQELRRPKGGNYDDL